MTASLRRLVAIVALALPFGLAHAQSNPLGALRAVSADVLDSMRGGFETPGGLQVSFGIERSVYINGNLVTTTSLNVADTGRLSTNGSALALIQSGSNNVFGANLAMNPSTSAAIVIQNSLDNQKIQGVTAITATVNSLALTKSMAIQSSIQDALTGSLRH